LESGSVVVFRHPLATSFCATTFPALVESRFMEVLKAVLFPNVWLTGPYGVELTRAN
jgi:hypothetical protein